MWAVRPRFSWITRTAPCGSGAVASTPISSPRGPAKRISSVTGSAGRRCRDRITRCRRPVRLVTTPARRRSSPARSSPEAWPARHRKTRWKQSTGRLRFVVVAAARRHQGGGRRCRQAEQHQPSHGFAPAEQTVGAIERDLRREIFAECHASSVGRGVLRGLAGVDFYAGSCWVRNIATQTRGAFHLMHTSLVVSEVGSSR